MHKKVIVIGAGISGLSAAIYSRRRGFDVTVFEQGTCPGGVSASWVRHGYTFDGGIHWLVGTSSRFQPFHRRWIETGALQANNPIEYADPVFVFKSGSVTLHLWRDIDRFTQELVDFAPEDGKTIRSLRRHVELMATYIVRATGSKDWAKRVVCLPTFVPLIWKLLRSSAQQYIERFENPHIREFLRAVLNPEQNAVSLVGTLMGYVMGDNGYPEGGSRRLADNMEQTALQAGCGISYRAKVEKVCVEGGKVKGVMVNGTFHSADYVIVAMDTHTALRTLFDQPLTEKWARKLLGNIDSEQCSLLSLGINKDLGHLPSTLRLHMKKPAELAGYEYTTLWVYRYSGQQGFAPEGCCSLTILFMGDTYDYWKQAQSEGSYSARKQEFVQKAKRLLTSHLPEIEGCVVVEDLATPVTYERYCNCHRGGYMGIWREKQNPFHVPVKSQSVRGLFFCGMRTRMSGGMPIAVQSGYKAAMSL